jgi:hypothetical protein
MRLNAVKAAQHRTTRLSVILSGVSACRQTISNVDGTSERSQRIGGSRHDGIIGDYDGEVAGWNGIPHSRRSFDCVRLRDTYSNVIQTVALSAQDDDLRRLHKTAKRTFDHTVMCSPLQSSWMPLSKGLVAQ